jgi:hypothetical protein
MNKQKKCAYCKTPFQPFNSLQKSCYSSECMIAFNAEQADKKWQKRKKAIKEKIKPLSKYKAELQDIINPIVHHLDFGHPCISCGGNATEAGHYYSRGAYSNLAYNLNNIYMQCHKCNVHLSGNIIGYDDGLIETFGVEFFSYIKFDIRKEFKHIAITKELIEEKKSIARQVLKEASSIQSKLSNIERLQLREYYNEIIGIYK